MLVIATDPDTAMSAFNTTVSPLSEMDDAFRTLPIVTAEPERLTAASAVTLSALVAIAPELLTVRFSPDANVLIFKVLALLVRLIVVPDVPKPEICPMALLALVNVATALESPLSVTARVGVLIAPVAEMSPDRAVINIDDASRALLILMVAVPLGADPVRFTIPSPLLSAVVVMTPADTVTFCPAAKEPRANAVEPSLRLMLVPWVPEPVICPTLLLALLNVAVAVAGPLSATTKEGVLTAPATEMLAAEVSVIKLLPAIS